MKERRYWTRDRVIDAMHAWNLEHGRPPMWQEWEKSTLRTPTARTVTERFGSWNTAIVAAGFESRPAHRAQDWPADRIIDALQAWTAEHGVTPRRSDWLIAGAATPSAATVGYRFGSWNAGIEAAGFTPRKQAPTTRWTKDLVAAVLLDHLLRTGSWPTYNGWRSSGLGVRPNSATIVALFGSFALAKRYAGWDGTAGGTVAVAVCSGCGTELDNFVIGCRPCWDRRRKQSSSARRLAAVESPLTTATPAAEAFAASTSDREPDEAAVRRREAA